MNCIISCDHNITIEMVIMKESPYIKYFKYDHLPPKLQIVSEPFCSLAIHLDKTLDDSTEKVFALRKLLESKDCAVRGAL